MSAASGAAWRTKKRERAIPKKTSNILFVFILIRNDGTDAKSDVRVVTAKAVFSREVFTFSW